MKDFSVWEFDLSQASMIRYAQDVPDALRCASCKNVFRDCVLQASCGDRFCTECFRSLVKQFDKAKCSTCEYELDQKRCWRDVFAERELLQLQVHCSSSGCQWIEKHIFLQPLQSQRDQLKEGMQAEIQRQGHLVRETKDATAQTNETFSATENQLHQLQIGQAIMQKGMTRVEVHDQSERAHSLEQQVRLMKEEHTKLKEIISMQNIRIQQLEVDQYKLNGGTNTSRTRSEA
ncbi:uncharacterized protein LOC134194668 [Corticium candelabrum]|uniref:uncharacterized protein LOC134194668 n=1 Tax=Corticium candelabrum TaxID=121492 RepID=UPI002E265CF4|nr:uncharacterized protein LOC134194668 [Corticium candelabrum]